MSQVRALGERGEEGGVNIMVDIEALGTKTGSAILSIGAVQFTGDGLGHKFFRPIRLFDSLMAGLTIDPNTVQWWRAQSPEARSKAQPIDGEVRLEKALNEFAAFVSKDDCIWAKGPDFDLVMLDAAYQAIGKPKPWHYRNARDVRTILALSGVKERDATVEHHALDDAIVQAEAVIEAYRALGIPLK